MKKVRLIVIDDQTIREIRYNELVVNLNNRPDAPWQFDLFFASKPSDAIAGLREYQRLAATDPEILTALVVLDLVLEGNGWQNEVGNVVSEIAGLSVPVCIVSARFQGATQQLTERLKTFKNDVLIIGWQLIDAGNEDAEVGALFDVRVAARTRISFANEFSPKKPFSVLHLTDPHFGKGKWNVALVQGLRNVVKKEKLESELLFLTGDTADKGEPQSYVSAADFISKLYELEIVKRNEDVLSLPLDRTFSCPGNHDFYRPIALAACLNVDVNYETKSTVASFNKTESKDWVERLGRKTYSDFRKKVTLQNDGQINDTCSLHKRFLHLGFVVLEVDLEQYQIPEYSIGRSRSQICNEIEAAVSIICDLKDDGLVVFIVAHQWTSDSTWGDFLNSISIQWKTLGEKFRVIYFCGHTHETPTANATYAGRILVVEGVPGLPNNSFPPNGAPSVVVATFARDSNDRIEKVKFAELRCREGPIWNRVQNSSLPSYRFSQSKHIWILDEAE
jgi:Calcineurin-like phosphoesterase